MDTRSEFLLHLYDALWQNIDRHINIVWQPIAALGASLFVLTLVSEGFVSMDAATTVIVGLVWWYVANIIDANAWYTRNLLIISNIERAFLTTGDDELIHFYYTKHRAFKPVTHFSIQASLGIGMGLFVVSYHFWLVVRPGLNPSASLDVTQWLPYLVAAMATIGLWRLWKDRKQKYELLQSRSPGNDRVADASAQE